MEFDPSCLGDDSQEVDFEEVSPIYRRAEILNQLVANCPTGLLLSSSATSSPLTIHDKLNELYLNQFQHIKNTPYKISQKLCSNLLSKLVARDSLRTLIVHLKPLNLGYSIILETSGSLSSETINIPYEETELLDHIDSQELPHTLVDLLEKSRPDLFYDGCIICEVRDSRRATDTTVYKSMFVLLRPTMRSVLADVNSIAMSQASQGHVMTADDCLAVEGRLIMENSAPLCLDASPTVGLLSNRMRHKRQALRVGRLERAYKPYSMMGALRKRLHEQLDISDTLPVLHYLQREKTVNRPAKRSAPIDWWIGSTVQPTSVDSSDVMRLAKEIEKPPLFGLGNKIITDSTPVITDEYILEAERPQGKLHKIRLVILRRPSEPKYLGELHISRTDWDESHCSFELGPLTLVEKYIDKFIDLFTEEGRKQVKITRLCPGQQTRSIMTNTALPNQATSPTITSILAQLKAPDTSTPTPQQQRLNLSNNNRETSLRLSHSGESFSGDSSGNSLLLNRRGLQIGSPVYHAQLSPAPTQDGQQSSQDHSQSNSKMLAQIASALPNKQYLRLAQANPNQNIQILPSDSKQSITLQNIRLTSLPVTSLPLSGAPPIILSAAPHPNINQDQQQIIQHQLHVTGHQQLAGIVPGRSIVVSSHTLSASISQGLITLPAGSTITHQAITRMIPTATILPTPGQLLQAAPVGTVQNRQQSVFLSAPTGQSPIRLTQLPPGTSQPIRATQLTQQQLLAATSGQQIRGVHPTRLQINPQQRFTRFQLRNPSQPQNTNSGTNQGQGHTQQQNPNRR